MTARRMPWYWPYDGLKTSLDFSDLDTGGVARVLNLQRGSVLSNTPVFEPSKATLGALDYERCVSAGSIPTRDVSHDWYNGQVWLAFSQAKYFVNAVHVSDSRQELGESANGRSRLRDALTLFDESGALLLTTRPDLSAALLNHDWPSLFETSRPEWGDSASVLVFGHGLLDAMQAPHKGLCAKAIPVCVPDLSVGADELQQLVLEVVSQIKDPKNLSPLPVMGIPGWFADSDAPGYYDDKRVYRAKPTPKGSSLHERLAFEWDGSTLALGKCAGQSLPEFQGEESPDSSEHGAG